MHGYKFTERLRLVLGYTRDEATRLRHDYIGTEHMLLGLVREGQSVGATVLQNLSVELDEIRQKIEEAVEMTNPAQTIGPDLPYTSRAKKVLELAVSEARDLNHCYISTEHLVLGLLAEQHGRRHDEHRRAAARAVVRRRGPLRGRPDAPPAIRHGQGGDRLPPVALSRVEPPAGSVTASRLHPSLT